jgi:hypothetical protein
MTGSDWIMNIQFYQQDWGIFLIDLRDVMPVLPAFLIYLKQVIIIFLKLIAN